MQSTINDWEGGYVHPAHLSSALLRNLGHLIDEFSARGLVVWVDDADRWHWRWRGTGLRGEAGLPGLGEAIAEAAAVRFPTFFEYPPLLDRAVSG